MCSSAFAESDIGFRKLKKAGLFDSWQNPGATLQRWGVLPLGIIFTGPLVSNNRVAGSMRRMQGRS